MKQTTCAIVMINKNGDIFGCHGTSNPIENGYDFPKGCYDNEDGNHLTTALRELYEETGHVLSENEIKSLIDGGIHRHNAKKDIHLFILQTESFPSLDKLKCTTYFEARNGEMKPEINGYKIIKKEEREKFFYRVLQDKFELIDKLNEKKQ